MKKYKLSNICSVLNGYAFKSKKYADEGVRIVRISNVQKGIIVDEDPKYYSQENMENLNKYILEENDLLISLTGNVGRVGLIKKEMLPAALNQRVACLRLKSNDIDKKYLFHYMNSNRFEQECIKMSKGIAQKNLSTKSLKSLKIPVPPLQIQKKIVEVLDKAQELIGLRKKQIELLDELIQSIFYDMFGNPISNTNKWEIAQLGKIADSIKYGSNSKSKSTFNNESIPVLRIPNITATNINLKNLKYQDVSEDDYKKYCLEKGDLLLVRSNGNPDYIGRCAMFNLDREFIYASYLIRIRLKQDVKVTPNFLQYQMATPDYRKKLTSLSRTTAGNYNINTPTLKKLKFITPPIELQNEFAKKVQKIEEQKEIMQESLSQMEDNFNSLMQKAFKGDLFEVRK